MKRLALICAALTLATTGCVLDAEDDFIDSVELAGGTRAHAIPQEMLFDSSGNLVGEVHVTVTAGWLNSPHSVYTTITSVDGQPNHDHGTQLDSLSDLQTVEATVGQGSADVIIPWDTDSEPKRLDDLYTVCSNIVFGADHHGPISCLDFGPFF